MVLKLTPPLPRPLTMATCFVSNNNFGIVDGNTRYTQEMWQDGFGSVAKSSGRLMPCSWILVFPFVFSCFSLLLFAPPFHSPCYRSCQITAIRPIRLLTQLHFVAVMNEDNSFTCPTHHNCSYSSSSITSQSIGIVLDYINLRLPTTLTIHPNLHPTL